MQTENITVFINQRPDCLAQHRITANFFSASGLRLKVTRPARVLRQALENAPRQGRDGRNCKRATTRFSNARPPPLVQCTPNANRVGRKRVHRELGDMRPRATRVMCVQRHATKREAKASSAQRPVHQTQTQRKSPQRALGVVTRTRVGGISVGFAPNANSRDVRPSRYHPTPVWAICAQCEFGQWEPSVVNGYL